MAKFKKKPVVIDALHWTGDNGSELLEWIASHGENTSGTEVGVEFGDITNVTIKTKEGVMRAPPGHWILRGIAGEYYTCAPEIFSATYESDAAPANPGNEPRGVFVAMCTPACVQMSKKMYMAYCENSGNKNFRGEECPPWEALSTAIQSHWCAACVAALPHLNVP